MKKHITPFMLLSLLLAGCVNDDDTTLPPYEQLVYLQDFEEAQDNTILDITGFTNYSETGTSLWTEQLFDNNGYTEFTNTTETSAVGWLVTPAINLGIIQRTLRFQSAQHHMPQDGSKLEVFIASDFNGTDVTAANWVPLEAKTPDIYTDWYKFISSGEINLAQYSGVVHIAFRATHATSASGYYIDNVKVY
ncbi:hypothetical protein [Flavobacterium sp. NRK1]|jgi:hypothetical protein|uniref:hypothetical protein n=1 Tax=Flavobacterium sp. NRK1 TaxID=2954929 RepID=UPI002092A1ED|nr:hypothetical protein [Flavobacterium sp. NRK1]MCO6147578.1 hypothetical protein [Flavobacterium sp. NRK1]